MKVSKLILFVSAALVHITIAQEQTQQQTQLQTTNHNIDDTSLFREVEDAIDEDSEQDDAYRILKSLQEVTEYDEEDTVEDDEDQETAEDVIEDDDDDATEDDEDNDDIIIEQEGDDDDEEEEDDDFTPEFPEFQNEETTDFFEHLPQQPMDHAIDNQLKENDDIDEDMDELTQPITEEEDDDDEIVKEVIQEPDVSSFPTDNNIPWQRPDPAVKTDDNSHFYQDIHSKTEPKLQYPQQGFKIWHILFVLLILVIVYRSSFKRRVSSLK
jgi:hypothetical protein